MATWADVARLSLALPETSEVADREGLRQWKVKAATFVWERPLRKADLLALGAGAPDGPVLGVRVADEGEKHALVLDQPEVYFTTPHFDGYPAVLARLDALPVDELAELVEEAWLLRAPKRLAKAWLSG